MARVKVTSRVPIVNARMRGGAEQGVRPAAEHVLTESRRVVPIEEGTLERSGQVEADGLHAEVGYGGHDERTRIVAIVQHERLDYRHAAGRTPKYLEGPLVAEADTVLAIIAAAVRRAL